MMVTAEERAELKSLVLPGNRHMEVKVFPGISQETSLSLVEAYRASGRDIVDSYGYWLRGVFVFMVFLGT